ncbi:MAG: hypothetical protein R6U39_05120 [Candidatus Aegiribacteria sp.]
MTLLFTVTLSAQTLTVADDFWLEASGSRLEADSLAPPSLNERAIKSQLKNGNRTALVPLLRLLVNRGRIREAEAWMDGRGSVVPVTRRDLGIALSWYGRFQFYDALSTGPEIPSDLTDDDYGNTLAAVIAMGWMRTSHGGLFHPNILAGRSDLEMLAGVFFPVSMEWERDWIGMSALDSLFAAGIREGVSP